MQNGESFYSQTWYSRHRVAAINEHQGGGDEGGGLAKRHDAAGRSGVVTTSLFSDGSDCWGDGSCSNYGNGEGYGEGGEGGDGNTVLGSLFGDF